MTLETAPEKAETPRVRYGPASVSIAVVFGLLNAYALWTAIGNLVTLPKAFGSVTPWWLLILDVAVPLLAYTAAFLLGRRASLGARTAFFLVALAVVACSTVGSIAYVQSHFGFI
jgi:hypothetical protein